MTLRVVPLLLLIACGQQAEQDLLEGVSPMPGGAFDVAPPPGAGGLTLGGTTAMVSGDAATFEVTAADLMVGDRVEIGYGTGLGAGFCPYRGQTGGTPCLDIAGRVRALGDAYAYDDGGTVRARITVQLTTPRDLVHVQAFLLRGSASATSNALQVDVTQPYPELDPRVGDLELAVADQGTEVDGLTSEMGDVWTAITSIVTSITALEVDVAGLSTTLSTLTTAVGDALAANNLVDGTQSAQLDGHDIQFTANAALDGAQTSRLDGVDSLNNTQTSRLDGVDSLNNTQTSRLDGVDSLNNTQTSRLDGVDTLNNTQTSRLDGVDSLNNTQTSRLDGVDSLNNTQTSRLDGVDSLNNTQTSRLDGIDSLNNTQTSRLDGIDTLNGTQTTRLNGIDTLNTTQNGRLDGIDTLNGTQTTRLNGIDTLNTTQNGRLDGIDTLNGTQTTRLNGIDTLNTTQNGRLDGVESVNGTQQSKINQLFTLENVRTIVTKATADSYCAGYTAVHVGPSYVNYTGNQICAADGRSLTTCQSVLYVYVTNGNGYGRYANNDLSCGSAVSRPWPWGNISGGVNSLSGEWGHGDTWVVCCS